MIKFVRVRILAWLVLAVILLRAGLIPGAAQSAADSTWLTYTEPALGFKINYPADWVVRLAAENPPDQYPENVVRRSIGFFGPNSRMVFVDVWENRSDLSVAAWLERYPALVSIDPSLTVTPAETTVAGQPAVQLTGKPVELNAGIPWQYHTQFRHGDWMIAVRYAALQPDVSMYRAALASFAPAPVTAARSAASALSAALPPAEYGVSSSNGVQTCCGYNDPEYNPFPCNTAENAGNCTWWARYRRRGGSEANLVACTGNASTWDDCAASHYPRLLSDYPGPEAVAVFLSGNHVAFVERVSENRFQASDLSWDDPCPNGANYYTSSFSGKRYILHPDIVDYNEPPEPPELKTPGEDIWLTGRDDVKFTWEDGGDPDDTPLPYRNFLAYINRTDGDWSKVSGWHNITTWKVDLPADGAYTWRVQASDGLLKTSSEERGFFVDTRPPAISFSTAPATGRWYNADQTLAWTVADPTPGSGADYARWGWDDDSPDNKDGGATGSVALSAAGQGKHTLYVRGWDKAGFASAVISWGWLGYDTVAPVAALNAGNPATGRWYNRPVALGWTNSDPAPGSGTATVNWRWDGGAPVHIGYGAQGSVGLPQTQGRHSVSGQSRDLAGNQSAVVSAGWFGYDSFTPEPPQITTVCGAINNRWQNTCPGTEFTWQADEVEPLTGAGVSGYAYGWGLTATVQVGDPQVATGVTPPDVAPAGGWGQGYLHVQAVDGAGNRSAPATFGLWYDGVAPSADFSVTPGELPTVTLTIAAADDGSGVSSFRVANNDQVWTDWQGYTESVAWPVSPADDDPRVIYVQVRDWAGNESAVISREFSVGNDFAAVEPVITPFTEPEQPGAFGLSLNEGALYTNVPTVTVTAGGPGVTQIGLSADAGETPLEWQATPLTLTWVLTAGTDYIPRRVYGWFKDADGALYGPYFDEIIFDSVAPGGNVKISNVSATQTTLALYAWDASSGPAEMRVGLAETIAEAEWQAYTATVTLPATEPIFYAQFKDRAGNVSALLRTRYSTYLPIIAR